MSGKPAPQKLEPEPAWESFAEASYPDHLCTIAERKAFKTFRKLSTLRKIQKNKKQDQY
jgi:hypothetical protein